MSHRKQALAQPIVVPIHVGNSNHENDNEPESKTNNDADQSMEWAMIEINGELLKPTELPQHQTPSGLEKENGNIAPDSIELGSLWFDGNDTPHMIVGTHELQGKVEKLKQPFCVLEKEMATKETSYRVKGIVSRKILFSQYPKTIMTRS